MGLHLVDVGVSGKYSYGLLLPFSLILVGKDFRVFTDRIASPEICLYTKTLLFMERSRM